MDRRESISILVVVLIAGVGVRADMMSAHQDFTGERSERLRDRTGPQPTHLSGPFVSPCLDFANLNSPLMTSSIDPRANVVDARETPPLRILTDQQNSLDLCLYGLVGLALCRSGHWVKRPSLGFVPEWYCSGGPSHIGQSLGVSPDTPCMATVCCPVQPECVVERLIPQYRLRIVVSLWRKSQFTPDIIASRAPPLRSC